MYHADTFVFRSAHFALHALNLKRLLARKIIQTPRRFTGIHPFLRMFINSPPLIKCSHPIQRNSAGWPTLNSSAQWALWTNFPSLVGAKKKKKKGSEASSRFTDVDHV